MKEEKRKNERIAREEPAKSFPPLSLHGNEAGGKVPIWKRRMVRTDQVKTGRGSGELREEQRKRRLGSR